MKVLKSRGPWVSLTFFVAFSVVLTHWYFLEQDWSAFLLLEEQNVEQSFFDHPPKAWSDREYDGQFFFALGLHPPKTVHAIIKNPDLTGPEAPYFRGITIDNPVLRAKRIGYPMLSWVLSGFGNPRWLPFIMVLINVIGIGLTVGACFAFCSKNNTAPQYSLVPLLFIGLWMCLFRGLSDQLGIAFALLSLVLLLNGRLFWFGIMGVLAMLTKETVVFLLFGFSATYALEAFKARKYSSLFYLSLPFIGYAAWSLLLGWNAQADGTFFKHFDLPFAGIIKGYQMVPMPLFWWGTFLPILIITLESIFALLKKPGSITSPYAIAFWLNVSFALIMSYAIYEDPFSFARNLLPLQVSGLLVLYHTQSKISIITIGASLIPLIVFLIKVIPVP